MRIVWTLLAVMMVTGYIALLASITFNDLHASGGPSRGFRALLLGAGVAMLILVLKLIWED